MSTLTEKLQACGVFTYPLNVPIESGHLNDLMNVMRVLNNQIENSWDCDRETCTDENPQCDYRQLKAAKAIIEKIVFPEHRTLSPDRLSNAAEAIYLRRWQKENERHRCVNGGFGALELILTPTRIERENHIGGIARMVPAVSQRDAEVAATVIQWLGTNCGRCFIDGAEREIREANAERSDFDKEKSSNIWQTTRILPTHENLARQAVAHVLRADDPKFQKAVSAVIAAIQASHAHQEVAGAC